MNTSLSLLVPEDFYSEGHRTIFRAVEDLASRDIDVDYITVGAELRHEGMLKDVGGKRYLWELTDSVPAVSNTKRYAEIVRWHSVSRQALDEGERMMDRILLREDSTPEGAITAARDAIDAILRGDPTERVGSLAGDVLGLVDLLRAKKENQGVIGIPTGIRTIDAGTGGLQKGRLYLIAGRPGMGKSLILMQMAYSIARAGYKVLFQSPEMYRVDYLERLAAAIADVPWSDVQEGNIDDDQIAAMGNVALEIGDLDLIVDDAGTQTISRVRNNLRRYAPDVLFVDYLQKLTPDNGKIGRTEQVTQLSYGIDATKKDFDLPVVAAAQLSRSVETRSDKRPMLSDLRDSGALEQDADVALFPFREHYYDRTAPKEDIEVICSKNRHGDTWEATLQLRDGAMWVDD